MQSAEEVGAPGGAAALPASAAVPGAAAGAGSFAAQRAYYAVVSCAIKWQQGPHRCATPANEGGMTWLGRVACAARAAAPAAADAR